MRPPAARCALALLLLAGAAPASGFGLPGLCMQGSRENAASAGRPPGRGRGAAPGRREALRRLLLGGVGGALLGAGVGAGEAGAQDLFKAKPERGINKRTQRLYGCTTQQNCVSTAAIKNPTQFSAAYDYTISTQDAGKAWKILRDTIAQDPSLRIVEEDEGAGYLRAEGTSKVPKDGVDDVEFLFVPEQKILTYRSASRENVFVYPYQVPIPDGGYQKARMKSIRDRLGWVELNYAGDGVYSDGCGKNGDKACNPFGGLESLGGGDYVPEDGLPRADKFRLPW